MSELRKRQAVLAVMAALSVSAAIATYNYRQHNGWPAGISPTAKSPEKTFNISVADGKVVSGPAKMTVKLGDSVRVNIRAGGSEEVKVELEGYGIITESAPADDAGGGFIFVADKPGSFKYYSIPDSENGAETASKIELGTIVVKP
jgi:plastocyanin